MVMSRSDDDAAARAHLLGPLLDDRAEFVIERLVYLVEQQYLRIDLLRNRESKARMHPLREARDGILECVAESTTLLDDLDDFLRSASREAREDADEQTVLTSGQPWEKAGLGGQERGNAA